MEKIKENAAEAVSWMLAAAVAAIPVMGAVAAVAGMVGVIRWGFGL